MTAAARRTTRTLEPKPPFNFEDLTRAEQDFVRAIASGSGSQVRFSISRLDRAARERLASVEAFRELLAALHKEAEWRPPPGTAIRLYGKLDPRLKALRQVTARRLARARGLARRLVAGAPRFAKPNQHGCHYRAAEAFAQILKTMPGVEEVYLFGSVARGQERQDSDVDMLVIRCPGMTDRKYSHLIYEELERVADLFEFPRVAVRPGVLPNIPCAPPFHLLARDRRPRRWSDWGMTEGEPVTLWRLDSSESLCTARSGNPKKVVTLHKGPRAVILYEASWHALDGGPDSGFGANGLVEVYDSGHLELRQVELYFSPRWNPEVRCTIQAHGGRYTTLSTRLQIMVEDVIADWIMARIGDLAVPISYWWHGG